MRMTRRPRQVVPPKCFAGRLACRDDWPRLNHHCVTQRACGAGGSIKSCTPAEMLGRGPRPRVKRSGTRGRRQECDPSPRSGRQAGFESFNSRFLGFRCASPQALCFRPLRGLTYSLWPFATIVTVVPDLFTVLQSEVNCHHVFKSAWVVDSKL
jgi:hypothetical protein